MKKFFCVIALVSTGILAACSSRVEPLPAAAIMENREIVGVIADTLIARGVVESAESRNVYSTSGFFVEHVYAEVGDIVSEGQILAVLDTEDLELIIAQNRLELENLRLMAEIIPPQRQAELNTMRQMATLAPRQQRAEIDSIRQAGENAVSQSRRMFEEAYSNLRNNTNLHILAAENALTAATLQLETISTDHERLTVLYEAGNLSRSAFEQSETALYAAASAHTSAVASLAATRLAAQNELEMLRENVVTAETSADITSLEIAANMASLDISSQLESMEHAVNLELTALAIGVEQAEIALRLLERQMEDSVITAPIGGTVTAVFTNEGAIGAGLLFIVEDTENLHVITRFREYDIGRVKPGMSVAITSDATSGTVHEGEITRISPAAVLGSPVVEFEVEIAIPHGTGLRIGMNTRVEITP